MPNPGKAALPQTPFRRRRGHLRQVARIFVLVGFMLVGCQANPTARPSGFSQDPTLWHPVDLRSLDPVDSTAGFDLVALYARQRDNDGELRLDFLDMDDPFGFDLYLVMDFLPGGGGMLPIDTRSTLAWDACLVIRANQSPFGIDAGGNRLAGRLPRVVRDPFQDSLTVRWNTGLFPANPERLKIEAYLTHSGERMVADMLGPVRTDRFAPGRAPLILAFWDTLPADTPAQALRRWDGAHTGPLGSRHGLANVIRAVAKHRIPVFLLDLKTPNALAALDALGSMSQVRTLARQGLLNLPDVYAGGPAGGQALAIFRETSEGFEFPTSKTLYGALKGESFPGYSILFAQVDDPSHVHFRRGVRIVPLPSSSPSIAGGQELSISANENESSGMTTGLAAGLATGLPVEIRAALLRAALSPDPGDLVVLGESLPQSVWGDIALCQTAMEYIARHPWIQPLDSAGLQSFPVTGEDNIQDNSLCPPHLCQPSVGAQNLPASFEGQPVPSGTGSNQVETFLLEKISSLPPGHLADTAWLAFINLTRPTPDPQLQQLRANYLGQIHGLVLGAEWAGNPTSQSRCDVDADLDGMEECILSSETVFAILDPRGARVTYAFINHPGNPHDSDQPRVYQIIGPASQFSVGISDPSTWQLDRGPASDPNEIPGAFSDQPDPFRPYIPTIENGAIHFSSMDGSTQKVISLLDEGLSIAYFTSTPMTVQVPLALSPSDRYQPGGPWQYMKGRTTHGLTWGLPSYPRLETHATVPLQLTTAVDSGFLLRSPEDPNRDYPSGHFLPFPLAVIDLQVTEKAIIEIFSR